MADKILMEAFDKLKAIEESDDPFCIGAKDEPIEEANDPFCIGELSENEEDVEEAVVEEAGDDFDRDELEDYEEPAQATSGPHADEDKSYEVEDHSGNHYGVYFQGEGRGDPHVFIEANGITVAHFAVGGAGPMNAKVMKPEELLDAIVAFATQGR